MRVSDWRRVSQRTLRITVPSTRLAFSDRRMRRVVEPGAIDLWLRRSCAERVAKVGVSLVGDVYEVSLEDARCSEAKVTRWPANPRR
jgi:hypothetical protein